jgi:hypothetical protein
MNDNIRRQNQITGFLLGLGIGLVVGLVFQPRMDGYTGGFIEGTKSDRKRLRGTVPSSGALRMSGD